MLPRVVQNNSLKYFSNSRILQNSVRGEGNYKYFSSSSILKKENLKKNELPNTSSKLNNNNNIQSKTNIELNNKSDSDISKSQQVKNNNSDVSKNNTPRETLANASKSITDFNNVSDKQKKKSAFTVFSNQDMDSLKELANYLWPKDSYRIRAEVVLATSLTIASKLITVQVPILFKQLIDMLVDIRNGQQGISSNTNTVSQIKSTNPSNVSESSNIVQPETKQTESLESDSQASDTSNISDVSIPSQNLEDIVPILSALDTQKSSGSITTDLVAAATADPAWTEALLTTPMGLIAAYGIARISTALFGELRQIIFSNVGVNAMHSISVKVFKKLHNLDLQYHLTKESGALAKNMDRGSRGIQWVLSVSMFNVFPTILEIGLVTGLLVYQYSAGFGLLTISCMAGYTVFTTAVTQWRASIRQKMNKLDQQVGSVALDSLLNFETVKYLCRERVEINHYSNKWSEFAKQIRKTQVSLSFLNLGQSTIFSVGIVGSMYMSALGVYNGTMTAGDLVMINALLIQLATPLSWLGTVYSQTRQSLLDMEQLFALLKLESKVKEPKNPLPLPNQNGMDIEFRDAKFAYPAAAKADKEVLWYDVKKTEPIPEEVTEDSERPYILDGVSFKIPSGSTAVIMGSSGSGKSTILRLLYRFYDLSDGQILANGVNIADISSRNLRPAVSIVPQDVGLFNTSIRGNLEASKPDITEREMQSVLKNVGLWEAVQSWDEGLDTQVGERGMRLSGGEKQRLAVARAFLKHPQLLILDEGTSALDGKTEDIVLRSIKNFKKDKRFTMLLVAHRFSETVIGADQVLFFHQGKLHEQGTHQELLRLNGMYANTYRLYMLDAIRKRDNLTKNNSLGE